MRYRICSCSMIQYNQLHIEVTMTHFDDQAHLRESAAPVEVWRGIDERGVGSPGTVTAETEADGDAEM